VLTENFKDINTLVEFPSGQTIKVVVKLLDKEGHVISNENNAQITLYTQSMKSYLEEKGIKDERLSYGTHVEEGFSASIKNNEVSARNGIFVLDELII
jgi:hypothetical protein